MKVRGLLVLLLLPGLAAAQEQYWGTVAVTVGISEGDPADLQIIPLHAGDIITRENIRASIQALMDTGHYRYVEVAATGPVNAANITFKVQSHRFFSSFRLEPAGLLERPISAYFRLPFGEKFSNARVERIRAETVELLKNAGYFNATVTPEYPPSENPLLVTVVLNVTGTPGRAKINNIEIRSNDKTFSARELKEALKIFPGDDFLGEKLDQGIANIRRLFANTGKNFGFLNTRIQPDPKYDPNTNGVDLAITIEPGQFTVVETKPPMIPEKDLRAMTPVFEEGTIDDDLIAEGRTRMVEYLQREGYFEAVVASEDRIDVPEGAVQINYAITPGPRHTVRAIQIQGNSCFSDDQIKKRMKIKEAGGLNFLSRGLYSPDLMNGDKAAIQSMYRTAGFEGAVVRGHQEEENHVITVVIEIQEGSRSAIGQLAFLGNTAIPADALRQRLSVKEREASSTAVSSCRFDPPQPAGAITEGVTIYTPTLIADARTNLMGLYYSEGFPDVRITPGVDRDTDGGVRVTFQIVEGERHAIGQILVAGNTLTAAKIVRRTSGLDSYKAYNPEEILKAQQRLYASGLFNRVDIVPLDEEGGFIRNLLIQVEDAKPILVTYGFGAKEFEGPRVTTEISHNNLWGLGRSLTARFRLGLHEKHFQTTYREPRLFNWNLQGFGSFFIEKSRRPLFQANSVNFSIQVVRRLSAPEAKEQKSVLFTSSYQTVNLEDINVNFLARRIPELKGIIQIARVGASFVGDWRDDVLNPTRGKFTTATFEVANKAWGSEVNFVSLFDQTNYYKTVGSGVVALAERVGWKVPYSGGRPSAFDQELPISERYFAGGSTTLRGFGLDEAGPTARIGGVIVPGGGQLMTVGNVEYRVPLALPDSRGNRRLGGAIFYDTGNVFERPTDFTLRDFTHTAGAGLRFQTPLGPVRLDVGFNLRPKFRLQDDGSESREKRIHVFFTLGQTF